MNKTITAVIAAGAAIAIATGAFWAGSYYQRTRFSAGRQFGMMGTPGPGQQFGRPGLRQPGDGTRNSGGPRGERFLKGRLDRIEDDKLTLTTQLGSIKVTLADDAQVKSANKAKLSDLKVGQDLIIQSATSADGQLTAKSIIQD